MDAECPRRRELAVHRSQQCRDPFHVDFSADASHELKTPLTIIRGELEIALRSGEIPHGVERTMLDLLDETGRLVHIVEGLLLLSQADAGKFPVGTEMVARASPDGYTLLMGVTGSNAISASLNAPIPDHPRFGVFRM